MAFCENCGVKLEENAVFCGECGSKVSNVQTAAQQTAAPAEKKPMSKKSKIAILVIAVLAILGLVGYQVGKSMTDRDKVVSGFTQALADKNIKKVKGYLTSSDNRLVIDDKSVQILLDYVDKNPLWLQTLKTSLEEQSKSLTSKNKTAETGLFSLRSNALFQLKKDGKKFLFFDDYKVEVKPYFLEINTSYKDTEIFVNDTSAYKSAQENEVKQLGPYMPGLYKIKAVYKGEYAEIQSERELTLVDGSNAAQENNLISTDMRLEGSYIEISSSFPDAKVFINGKGTGLTVDQAKNIGPVDNNTKVQLKKDFPWGSVASEEVKVDGSYLEINLNPVNDEVKNQIMSTVNQFNSSYMDALTERNPDKLASATELKKSDVKYNVDNLTYYQTFFKGKYTKAIYDLDSVSVNADNGSYRAEIVVSLTSNSVYYTTDPNIPATDQTYIYKYNLVYDANAKAWLVDSNYSGYSLNSNNQKEFNF